MRSLFTLLLALSLPCGALAPDRRDREERRERREAQREDKRYWKEREKEEKRYWKERRREERHRFHERDLDRDDHRDWDHAHPRHRHTAPPWMRNYWRPGERHYAALVPGDPSRIYVFVGGRWVLRRLAEPRARLDLDGAFRLPVVPPPVPLPRIGLDLHVVLFD